MPALHLPNVGINKLALSFQNPVPCFLTFVALINPSELQINTSMHIVLIHGRKFSRMPGVDPRLQILITVRDFLEIKVAKQRQIKIFKNVRLCELLSARGLTKEGKMILRGQMPSSDHRKIPDGKLIPH